MQKLHTFSINSYNLVPHISEETPFSSNIRRVVYFQLHHRIVTVYGEYADIISGLQNSKILKSHNTASKLLQNPK